MVPHRDDGCRIDSPILVSNATRHNLAAIAATYPPEDHPLTLVLSLWFNTGSKAEFSFELPSPNSSQFKRPIIMASFFLKQTFNYRGTIE